LSEKLLVLIIDVDNDIGMATKTKTPIAGEENVRRLAFSFAMERPEDSDVNVVFAGLQLYYKLKEEGRDVEIAVIGGDARDYVRASLMINDQVKHLKEKLGVGEAIIVTDSPVDEVMLPVVQSHLKIAGVKRVIVEQWRGVEVTYTLIARYIKKALTEPRFSRTFLGVPGAILLLVGLLKLTGYLDYAVAMAGILMGGVMVVRGFGLEDKLYEYWGSSPIMFIASLLATVLLIAGVGLIANSIREHGLSLYGLGDGISAAAPLLGLAAFSVLVGKSVIKLLSRDIKVWHDIVGMVLAIVFAVSFSRLGEALLSLPEGASSQLLKSVLIESGFVQLMLAGIGLSAVLTLIARALEGRVGGSSSEAAEQKS